MLWLKCVHVKCQVYNTLLLISDALAKKVMMLHENALTYKCIMEKARAVAESYENLMESHLGKYLLDVASTSSCACSIYQFLCM